MLMTQCVVINACVYWPENMHKLYGRFSFVPLPQHHWVSAGPWAPWAHGALGVLGPMGSGWRWVQSPANRFNPRPTVSIPGQSNLASANLVGFYTFFVLLDEDFELDHRKYPHRKRGGTSGFFGRGLNRLTPFFYYTHYPPPLRTNLGFGTKGQSTNPSVRSRHTLGRRWWLTKSLWSQKIVFYMYCEISEHNSRE